MFPSPPSAPRRSRTLRQLALVLSVAMSLCVSGFTLRAAQQPQAISQPPAGTPRSWIDQAAANEIHIVDPSGTPLLRYRIHKIDAKGDTTRDVIETHDGNVARLVERNGQPITHAEDDAEKARLQAILSAPDDFIRHHKRDSSTREDSLQLVRLMPQAMIYTYTPGQPQLPNQPSPQVVIDFIPNPAFKPPTMMADLLTGLAGRAWIDESSRRVTRIEARILHPVNFGWGIVGHVYPGGTLEFEQTSAGPNRWAYSLLNTHLTVRVVVKTMPMNDRMTAGNFQELAAPLSFQDAVRTLLATPVPLR